jgi:hypothetical protein
MSYAQGYQDISTPFLISGNKDAYPFYRYFRANPLHENLSLIYPREAGYNPFTKYTYIRQIQPFENKCATYQISADVILPSTKCYAKNGFIVTQP